MKIKSKKTKTKPVELSIDEQVKSEHKRIVDLLAKAEPGSAEYAKLLGQLKEFECIQNKKDELKNSDTDSKRKHIGTGLISAGAGIITTGAWFAIEKNYAVTGKTAQQFIGSIFKKH